MTIGNDRADPDADGGNAGSLSSGSPVDDVWDVFLGMRPYRRDGRRNSVPGGIETR